MQNEDEIEEIYGIDVRSERIGFEAKDLVACGHCSKQNPPNRLNCFYCGTQLGLPANLAAGLQFRPSPIDDWEPGMNLVVVGELSDIEPNSVIATVEVETDLLGTAISCLPPIPLFRIRDEEADEVAARLTSLGLCVERITDNTLAPKRPPTRLKAITFHQDETADLQLFNSGEINSIDTADVKLIVVGAIFKTSSAATVKRKRKETKPISETVAGSDHAVIDIYVGDDRNGFRILPYGFDFSCLGAEKSLLAVENLKILIVRLKEVFPNSIFDDTYTGKLAVLDHVWPRTVANTSKGMQRVGMKIERSTGESVSNEEQFTRYSRMRRELI